MEHLDALNPEQREAVTHVHGPMLVLAGAGSGKTRVLTTRIAHLLTEHGVPPDRILAVTFTNKAAGEMRDRIRKLLNVAPKGMWVGTFHAIGARLLRRHAPVLGWSRTFSIFDADQSLRLIKSTQVGLGIDPRKWSPKAMRSHISGAKNRLVSPERFEEENAEGFDPFARKIAQVYPAYQAALKAQNAFDFDDLLVKPVEMLQQNPDLMERYRRRFSFLLVDEFQDTNRAQFVFLESLAREHGNLMVVGDDDQSIYGWRGADIQNILSFEESFAGAKTVRLEQNYRSSQKILAAANAVIANNTQRKGKTLRTRRDPGAALTLVSTADETDEARWVVDRIEAMVQEDPSLSLGDVSILYRTNAQSRAMEDAFRRRGVPYQIVGGVRFYERREILEVLAYLRLIANPLDETAFGRVVNYPRRGVGKTTVERLSTWAAAEGIPILEAASRAEEAEGIPTGGVRGLKAFSELIRDFSLRAATEAIGELLEHLVEDLSLIEELRNEGPEGEDRADNVRELIAGALDFNVERLEESEEDLDTFSELDLFLQRVALVADVDRLDPDADAVTMMTLHNAKGLEFPVVFISGLEDGLFPLSRSYDDPHALEEERRLFYVGITRAEQKLFMTHAARRRRAGEMMYGRLSPFVDEVPGELIEKTMSEVKRGATSFTRRRVPQATQEQATTDQSWIDIDFDDASVDQDAPRMVKGERVLHDSFGSGTVGEISGFGRDLKVTVHFAQVGTKKLLVRYANLRKDYD